MNGFAYKTGDEYAKPIKNNRKDDFDMQLKVQLFLGEKLIESSERSNLVIKSKKIDRIVNDVFDNVGLQNNINTRFNTEKSEAYSA